MNRMTVTMEELLIPFQKDTGNELILDVRSREDYALAHIPGSYNIPAQEIDLQQGFQSYLDIIRHFDTVYVHSNKGQTARQAYQALKSMGLGNVVLVADSGFEDWLARNYPIASNGNSIPINEQTKSAKSSVVPLKVKLRYHRLMTGLMAGLVANLVVGGVDRLLDRLVSPQQKKREKQVRDDSPHHIAGSVFAEKLSHKNLSEKGRRRAQITFTLAYGVGWGLIYAALRQRVPAVSRMAGLPFGIAFYAACDGAFAPLFQLTPSVHRIPWQLNIKEIGNHLAWTATAEMTHRLAQRLSA